MTTTEIVIYQIKADKLSGYAQISRMMDQYLGTRPGFISRSVHQDHQDKTIFIDLVGWQTYDDALAAAEAVKNEPSMKPLWDAFDKLLAFHHVHPAA